jgi:hypothetical protein
MVFQAFNPSYLGGRGRRVSSLRPARAKLARPCWNRLDFGALRTCLTWYCISGWTFFSFSEPSFQLQMRGGYPHADSGTTETTPTWPRDYPFPSPLIHYWWLGITRFFPCHRLVYIFKPPGERKTLSLLPASTWPLPHFCNSPPSLLMNSITPMCPAWMLPCSTQRIWESSDQRLHHCHLSQTHTNIHTHTHKRTGGVAQGGAKALGSIPSTTKIK